MRNQQVNWGGICIPAKDSPDRAGFIADLLRRYTQLQIDGDPVLGYLQEAK